MTTGESIYKLRKDLGLSQEELGQKLLVSRQTVSLWETDQTVPTIDNLKRLKEIFGVSVDEILGLKDGSDGVESVPDETYRFTYGSEDIKSIKRQFMFGTYKQTAALMLIPVIMLLTAAISSLPVLIVGAAIAFVLIAIIQTKRIVDQNKYLNTNLDRVSRSTYEYALFDNSIHIRIIRENEEISRSKYCFADIEQIRQCGEWLYLTFGGAAYIIRKGGLKKDSALFSYMFQNPSKTSVQAAIDKWRITSIVLFVASLLSIHTALALIMLVAKSNEQFTQNTWIFFLLTPVTLASTVFGFILKAKGYKYKKNIIAGIIMTVLLLLYGSFMFIFPA